MIQQFLQQSLGRVTTYLLAPAIKLLPPLAAWNSRHPVVMGLYLLDMAATAIEQDGPNRLAKKLYAQLPESWTGANGPATEDELVNVIRLAIRLVKALRELTIR